MQHHQRITASLLVLVRPLLAHLALDRRSPCSTASAAARTGDDDRRRLARRAGRALRHGLDPVHSLLAELTLPSDRDRLSALPERVRATEDTRTGFSHPMTTSPSPGSSPLLAFPLLVRALAGGTYLGPQTCCALAEGTAVTASASPTLLDRSTWSLLSWLCF
jgi:hypothetical protein